MQQSNAPLKIVLPFANSGAKNTIPVASQVGITPGAASLTDGFPPLTRTPLGAGGVPPSGLDMNGILFEISAITRWMNAGANYYYDSAFATDDDVDGYPKGAKVLRSDATGFWLNTVDDNETDPEAGGAGWVPDYQYGSSSITMTNANVTLTPVQYGRNIIKITGVLTANLNLIFPTLEKEWLVDNKTSGAFTITAKTAVGSGVTAVQGGATTVYGNGIDILASALSVNDASTTVKGIVELATDAETNTGVDTVRAITPSNLSARTATETRTGIAEIATVAEAQGFTDDVRFITSLKLANALQGANQSLATSGYQRLPGGLIIQWGRSTVDITTETNTTINFPIAFPTACVMANAITRNTASSTNNNVFFQNVSTSTSQYTFYNQAAPTSPSTTSNGYDWFAIGY